MRAAASLPNAAPERFVMIRLISLALVSLAAVMPAPVRPQDAAGCDTSMATAELNACAETELTKADAALNEIYKKALTHIAANGGDKPYDSKSWEEALRKSQRAWVAYRDADCKDLVPMSWTGGTATSGEVLGCLKEKTEARAKDLKDRYGLE